LVSVIIPCFNAVKTLDETLRSVQRQTYQNLEIICVDDGSTDQTVELIEAARAADNRITLARQPNRGVSTARNTGGAASSGDHIAFLDADDLWHPTKVAKQVAALQKCDAGTGLVYNWSCLIDEAGFILDDAPQEIVEGDALERMCRRERIGNGSTAMVRRQVLLDVGGFDPAIGAGEDAKFHLACAARYKFALVPEHLTGYRLHAVSAVAKAAQFLEEFIRATEAVKLAHPQFSVQIEQQRIELAQWLYIRALGGRRLDVASRMMREIWRRDPLFAGHSFLYALVRPLLLVLRRKGGFKPRRFTDTFNEALLSSGA
jgi:glycosyltransferase involved in cell wall biosynthesis